MTLGFGPLASTPICGGPLRAIQVPGPGPFAAPPPVYDLISAFDSLLPGYVFWRADYDAMYAAWAANGFRPLTSTQALALVLPEHGAQPAEVTSIPQYPGIDEAPRWMNDAGTLP